MGCAPVTDRGLFPTTLSMLEQPIPSTHKPRTKSLNDIPSPTPSTPATPATAGTTPRTRGLTLAPVLSQRFKKPELWTNHVESDAKIPNFWANVVAKKLKKVQALYNMKDGWKTQKKMHQHTDVEVKHFQDKGSDWAIVRSDGVIPEHGLTILSVLMNYKLRGQHDATWEAGGVVKKLDRDTRITYLRTKRKLFIVRDMCLLTHEVFLKDETLISLSFSIKEESCPLQRGIARVNCNFHCWILRPLRDTDNSPLQKTHVTLLSHIDPGGTLGTLSKRYFYNLFGVKPIVTLRDFLSKQSNAHGYVRIRQSMYNFFVSQTPEETIHEEDEDSDADIETPCSTVKRRRKNPGFYDSVKNLHPKKDSDPVSRLIDRRLRYHGVKNPPPESCVKKKPKPPPPKPQQQKDSQIASDSKRLTLTDSIAHYPDKPDSTSAGSNVRGQTSSDKEPKNDDVVQSSTAPSLSETSRAMVFEL